MPKFLSPPLMPVDLQSGVLAVRATRVGFTADHAIYAAVAFCLDRTAALKKEQQVADSNSGHTVTAISGSNSPLIAVSECHRACVHQVTYATDRGGSEFAAHLSSHVCTSCKWVCGIFKNILCSR